MDEICGYASADRLLVDGIYGYASAGRRRRTGCGRLGNRLLACELGKRRPFSLKESAQPSTPLNFVRQHGLRGRNRKMWMPGRCSLTASRSQNAPHLRWSLYPSRIRWLARSRMCCGTPIRSARLQQD